MRHCLLVRYIPFFWLVGMVLPALYLFFAVRVRDFLNRKLYRDPFFVFFLFFVVLQFFSLVLSVSYNTFSFYRWLAGLHNVFAMVFFLFGFAYTFRRPFDISNWVGWLFFGISFLVMFGLFVSFFIPGDLSLSLFETVFGLKSKFTTAVFYSRDFYIFNGFPRQSVLGIYPNSAGLVVLMSYVLYVICFRYRHPFFVIFLSTLLLLACVFLTGSRIQLLSAIVISSFVLLVNSRERMVALFLAGCFMLAVLVLGIDYVLELRPGSNNARSLIYFESLKYMFENHMVLGTGFKIAGDDLIGLPYPLGSHSTFVGYVVKSGLLGGGLLLLGLFLFLFGLSKRLWRVFVFKDGFDFVRVFSGYSLFVIMIALFFEDLDSYELMTFLLGVIFCLYSVSCKRERLFGLAAPNGML